jgi:tetratricopeptide (TPR) repeat protein
MRRRFAPRAVALVVVVALTLVGTFALAGADEQFQEARELAFAGRRGEARELCETILAEHPGYNDVRILLGRLHAWDREYDEARRELRRVIDDDPDYSDASSALCDVEIWSGHPDAALEVADEALVHDPNNPDLLERKARALTKLDRELEAVEVVEKVLEVEPDRHSARKLYHRLIDLTTLNKIAGDLGVSLLQDESDWWAADFEYRRRFGWGSLIGRVNWAKRFGNDGFLYEVDAYPTLPHRTYLWVNLGVSSDPEVFPDVRYGVEAYHNFPKGWEASLGFRRLEFRENLEREIGKSVTIVTGTVAKYYGDWWISLDETIGGTGVPGGPTDPSQRVTLGAFSLIGEFRKRITPRVIIRTNAGYSRDDLTQDRTRARIVLTVGAQYHF